MGKMKTKSSSAKRFRVTKNGKVMRKASGMNHILSKKTSKRKRHLRKVGTVSATEFKSVKAMLPYA